MMIHTDAKSHFFVQKNIQNDYFSICDFGVKIQTQFNKLDKKWSFAAVCQAQIEHQKYCIIFCIGSEAKEDGNCQKGQQSSLPGTVETF